MYNLKVAIFDENMAVGKSKYLVTLYLYELRQPWFEGVLWFWLDFYWLCSFSRSENDLIWWKNYERWEMRPVFYQNSMVLGPRRSYRSKISEIGRLQSWLTMQTADHVGKALSQIVLDPVPRRLFPNLWKREW